MHKCHKPIKELHHFPSRIIGKPLQISKCQLRINTFQLRSMQATAGSRGHTCYVKSSIPNGVWKKDGGQTLRCQYQIKKNKEHLLFKCSSADLCGDSEDKSRAKNYTVFLQSSHVWWWWWWLLADCHHCSTSTHVIIVTADDESFVPHWCNRHCWSFSDPQDTGRANHETGDWINAAQQGISCLVGSQIWGHCCPPADVTEKS